MYANQEPKEQERSIYSNLTFRVWLKNISVKLKHVLTSSGVIMYMSGMHDCRIHLSSALWQFVFII